MCSSCLSSLKADTWFVVQMYDNLVAMGTAVPVPGNKAGSYLTAFSLQGFYTDINGIIAGFVQIFVDQSYWQSAVAASPTQAVKVSPHPTPLTPPL